MRSRKSSTPGKKIKRCKEYFNEKIVPSKTINFSQVTNMLKCLKGVAHSLIQESKGCFLKLTDDFNKGYHDCLQIIDETLQCLNGDKTLGNRESYIHHLTRTLNHISTSKLEFYITSRFRIKETIQSINKKSDKLYVLLEKVLKTHNNFVTRTYNHVECVFSRISHYGARNCEGRNFVFYPSQPVQSFNITECLNDEIYLTECMAHEGKRQVCQIRERAHSILTEVEDVQSKLRVRGVFKPQSGNNGIIPSNVENPICDMIANTSQITPIC